MYCNWNIYIAFFKILNDVPTQNTANRTGVMSHINMLCNRNN